MCLFNRIKSSFLNYPLHGKFDKSVGKYTNRASKCFITEQSTAFSSGLEYGSTYFVVAMKQNTRNTFPVELHCSLRTDGVAFSTFQSLNINVSNTI